MGYRRCWNAPRQRTPEGEREKLYYTLFIGGFVSYGFCWLVLAWYMLTEDTDANSNSTR
jgi:hypothetical protein